MPIATAEDWAKQNKLRQECWLTKPQGEPDRESSQGAG